MEPNVLFEVDISNVAYNINLWHGTK